MSKVRVLVVDDHAIVRRTICALLARDSAIDVICQTASGEDAVTKASELQPDLVTMDIGLPGITGIEAARQIRELVPNCKIIFKPARFLTDGERGNERRRARLRYKD